MNRIHPLALSLLLIAPALMAQEHEAGNYPDTLRGEVWIELEPIYGAYVDEEYPLSVQSAGRRALEEAALFYSAMIYGWSFQYEIGERARRIPEKLELAPVAVIPFGDPGLKVTEVEVKDMRVRLWTDYRLSDAQQRRLQVWSKGSVRNAQATGFVPMGDLLGNPAEHPGWLAIKTAVLEDAARAAIRSMLQGSERNRPKEASGFISLASFPRYYIDSGRWAASARFRVDIADITPFAVY